MSKSLSISLKKSNVSDLLLIWANHFQKTSDSLEKNVFFCMFLTVFPPFYAQEQQLSSLSLLSRSFLKIDVSDLLSSLFTRERLWANRSCCSLQKSNGERFPPVAHDKRAMEAILSFSQANHSFAPLITKNELFTRKLDERIPNPDKGQVRMWRMRSKVFIFKNSQGP